MTPEEIVAYLRGWIKLNKQEVYGSPRDFVNVRELERQLKNIEELSKEKERGW